MAGIKGARTKNFNAATVTDAAKFFRVSSVTIQNWITDGCPRNVDKLVSLPNIHEWLIRREKDKAQDGDSLRQTKTKVEIEKLRAQVDHISDKYMLRSDHDQQLKVMAASFPKFYESAVKKNYHGFAGVSAEECHVLLMEFGRQLMKAWAGE